MRDITVEELGDLADQDYERHPLLEIAVPETTFQDTVYMTVVDGKPFGIGAMRAHLRMHPKNVAGSVEDRYASFLDSQYGQDRLYRAGQVMGHAMQAAAFSVVGSGMYFALVEMFNFLHNL